MIAKIVRQVESLPIREEIVVGYARQVITRRNKTKSANGVHLENINRMRNKLNAFFVIPRRSHGANDLSIKTSLAKVFARFDNSLLGSK